MGLKDTIKNIIDKFKKRFNLDKKTLKLDAPKENYSELNSNNFMDKYSTEKSEEEIEYDKQNASYFYRIEGKDYKINEMSMLRIKTYIAQNNIQLFPISDENKYLINPNVMSESQKNDLLNAMIDSYYDNLSMNFNESTDNQPIGGKDYDEFQKMCRIVECKQYIAKSNFENGYYKEANKSLEEEFIKIYEFEEKLMNNDKELGESQDERF